MDIISANQSEYISSLNERVFYDIKDALRKTNELCANVTHRCNVTIYYLNGEHFMYRKSSRTYYSPTKTERKSSIVVLTL
jgi:hypothetical protein